MAVFQELWLIYNVAVSSTASWNAKKLTLSSGCAHKRRLTAGITVTESSSTYSKSNAKWGY